MPCIARLIIRMAYGKCEWIIPFEYTTHSAHSIVTRARPSEFGSVWFHVEFVYFKWILGIYTSDASKCSHSKMWQRPNHASWTLDIMYVIMQHQTDTHCLDLCLPHWLCPYLFYFAFFSFVSQPHKCTCTHRNKSSASQILTRFIWRKKTVMLNNYTSTQNVHTSFARIKFIRIRPLTLPTNKIHDPLTSASASQRLSVDTFVLWIVRCWEKTFYSHAICVYLCISFIYYCFFSFSAWNIRSAEIH